MANLADIKRKQILVTLADGKEREIKFTLNALADIEDVYGDVQIAFAALEKSSFKAIRCVLWAALRTSDKALTVDQVGDLIDVSTIGTLGETLKSVFDEDMPAVPESTKDPNAEPQQV